MMVGMDPLAFFTTPGSDPAYYDIATITYAELKDAGFIDWDADEWHVDWYDDVTKKRLVAKIEARYSNRNIGVLPPAQWRREIVRKLNEIAPKYNRMYAAVADGMDITVVADTHSKSRGVYSDFPQTMLDGRTQDYASNSNDVEAETVSRRPAWESYQQIKSLQDLDASVLDEIEVMFSALLAVQLPSL